MNCFEWQTKSSDYLDGTLMAGLRKEADDHIETCKECSERNKHYRIILSSIAGQPRSTLPIPLRKSPYSGVLARIDLQSRRTQWERAPWFVRTSIEGLGIVAIILIVVSAAPRIRTLYEKSVERRMEAYNIVESSGESDPGHNTALTRGNLAPAIDTSGDDFSTSEGDSASDASDDAGSDTSTAETDDVIRVGNSEIWRFNFKTDSPHDLRPKIVEALHAVHIGDDTPGVGGIEVPGGIQFDLIIPQSTVMDLKAQFEKLKGDVTFTHTARENTPTESFTWYKNKSKTKIPDGKARVVVWLSQM